jgi:hypothetical protein
MSARSTQEEVLPEMLERRRILQHAGTVLAEARSLLECLDQMEGKLNVPGPLAPGPRRGIYQRTVRSVRKTGTYPLDLLSSFLP